MTKSAAQRFLPKSYTREATYNKIWNAERPLVNHALKAKGFKKLAYPKGSAAPYYSTKRLVTLLDLAERKTPKKGHVRSSHKTLEHPYVLPSARNEHGNYYTQKKRKPRSKQASFHHRPLSADEIKELSGPVNHNRGATLDALRAMGGPMAMVPKPRKTAISNRRKFRGIKGDPEVSFRVTK